MKNTIVLLLLSTLCVACTTSTKPNVTPEQMQQNLQEAGAVRSEHAFLKNLAGDWKVEAKFWMDPNANPEVTKGKATAKLLYDGRYLMQNYKGSFMGKPFEGQGTIGFDNLNSKYFSTWIDSMSTMMMKSEGSSAGTDKLVFASAMTCPATREFMQGEEVITILDKNNYRYEAFQNKDGKKVKGMEINYSRVK